MTIGISGASGKTGYRIAEEALKKGFPVKLLTRKDSLLPKTLLNQERSIIDLSNLNSLDSGLSGLDTLIIATGARPSIDLLGPAKIDAYGVKNQVISAKRSGVKRIILISSLCTGRLLHPLNLFGLILIWKKIGEDFIRSSNLDWTIIRPGGLSEKEDDLENEHIKYTGADKQFESSIPRRILAKCCIEALSESSSIGKILEVTTSQDIEPITMKKALESI
tara:strand:- start:811 stop:1473 length:663 start_codon:yes stop_codon:yes gene_type:complete